MNNADKSENTIVVDGSKSVIVVADTHLGVKKANVSSRPIILSSFLSWVKELINRKGLLVNLGNRQKNLKPPQKLILLGDIVEFWDTTDRSIDACSRFIIQLLAETTSKKIYILGNHDYNLIELIWKNLPADAIDNKYPLGRYELQFFDGVYPPKQNTGKEANRPPIKTLRVGEEHYLFLHGHEFDKGFTLLPWKLMAWFRDAALAFGSYTPIIVALFILDLGISFWLGFGGFHGLILLALLASISISYVIFHLGRWGYNLIRSTKYKRKRALKGFVGWWKKFSKHKKKSNKKLNVVYGHTHLIDVVNSSEIETLTDKETSFKGYLLNLPAWSKDLSKDKEEVIQAVFLYIDEDDCLFFGWDWKNNQPFPITRELIKDRRAHKAVETLKLKDINWPEPLIKEWETKSKI